MKLAPPRRFDGATSKPSAASASGVALPPAVGHRPGFGGRRPRAARRTLRGLAILLGLAGVLALSDGVLTLVWQEPVSGLLAHFSQAELAQSLRALEHRRPTSTDAAALDGLPTDQQRMAYFARSLQQTARPAQAVGTIVIPRIGANFVVVAGTAAAALQKGPGIYSGTSVPGLPGTVGIAGHRTTYLAPFRRINELTGGDLITLQMPYGVFTYTVTGQRIVAPNDVSVLRPTGYDQVVLTACNPLYSATQRLAVFARLTSSVPTGLALGTSVPQTPVAVAPAVVPGDFLSSLLGATPPTGIPPFASVGSTVPRGQTDAIIVGPTTPAETRALGRTVPTPGSTTRPAAPQSTRRRASQDALRTTSPVRPTPAFPAPRHPISVSPTATPRGPVTPTRHPVSVTPTRHPVSVTPTRHPVSVTPTNPQGNSPRKPSSKSTTSPSSKTTTPPRTGQTQTRVQGQPGGPAPIIGTSGG